MWNTYIYLLQCLPVLAIYRKKAFFKIMISYDKSTVMLSYLSIKHVFCRWSQCIHHVGQQCLGLLLRQPHHKRRAPLLDPGPYSCHTARHTLHCYAQGPCGKVRVTRATQFFFKLKWCQNICLCSCAVHQTQPKPRHTDIQSHHKQPSSFCQ